MQSPIDGAVVVVYPVNAFYGLPRLLGGRDLVDYMNSFNHQDVVFRFNLAADFSGEVTVTSVDLARFQRASKSSSQSAPRGSDHIVKCCGMGLRNLRTHAVMGSDCAMYTKLYGLLLRRQVSKTKRSGFTLDTNV